MKKRTCNGCLALFEPNGALARCDLGYEIGVKRRFPNGDPDGTPVEYAPKGECQKPRTSREYVEAVCTEAISNGD